MIGLLKKIFETKQISNALLGLTPTTAQNKTEQTEKYPKTKNCQSYHIQI